MVKATRNFWAHRDGQHRRFAKGEEIPEDWEPTVGTRSLVDGPLPHLPDPDPTAATSAPAGEGPIDPNGNEPGPFPADVVAGYDSDASSVGVDQVVAWVLDDGGPGTKDLRARYALAREESGKDRATLIPQLAEIVAAG